MTTPVREGDILAGKYKVERVLAQGGMGVVVAAMHQQLEQRVALKFLLPEGMENEASLGRFLREAKAAVRLRSEHVARVLDVGTAETGSPYIVMEYLEGRDLSTVLEAEGRLSVREAVTYVLQTAEAVAEAHALGIVHRDLKPANLFLTRRADGTPCVKVLDFGISKLTSPTEMNLTKTSAIMGTPYYMAPEQLRSSKTVDLRSDIWSLGMILYELLTGCVAYQRETLPELCSAILFDPVLPPRTFLPELPEALEAVVMRALAKAPEDRYQNLAQLAQDVAPFAKDGERLAMRVKRVLGVGPKASDAPDELSVDEPAPRLTPADADALAETTLGPEGEPARRSKLPFVLAAAGAAVVGIAVAVTVTMLHRSPSSSSSTSSPSSMSSMSVPPPRDSVELPVPPTATATATAVTTATATATHPNLVLAPPAASSGKGTVAASARPRSSAGPAPPGDELDQYGTRK
jgi:serine/threonine-protein kinase